MMFQLEAKHIYLPTIVPAQIKTSKLNINSMVRITIIYSILRIISYAYVVFWIPLEASLLRTAECLR